MKTYEAIIGLEVHAQLSTQTKMFCGCSSAFGAPPNSNICPVCTAEPGALPVVNRAAVEMAIRAGLSVGSTIRKKSIFARKNYFYPDLAKGYQISQYEFPLCEGGHVDISTARGETKRISLRRIHLEEDAGKLTHDLGNPEKSWVDFNRCGIPLIEIVSGPDLATPQEAGDYLRKLRSILVYLDICDGNMQEGNFRCDANISIRPTGTKEFGTRTELKNLNSFKAIEKGIAHEIERQTKLLDAGKSVIQETRLWNDVTGETLSMRSKEEAHDYRYFPDPDLLPLIVDTPWVESVGRSLPELPDAKATRFITTYALPVYDAEVLTSEKALAHYFEASVAAYNAPKKISNWIMTELLRELKRDDIDIDQCLVTPSNLAALVKLIDDGTISGKIAKDIFVTMYKTGNPPEAIIEEQGLQQVSDHGELEKVIDHVMTTNTKQVEQYRAGKASLFAFFIGQVMKTTKGQANPQVVNDLLKKKLG